MDCSRRADILSTLLEGEQDVSLARHLEECEACRADADLLGRVAASLSAGDCPDEASLAALASGGGTVTARAHVARCAACDELVRGATADLREVPAEAAGDSQQSAKLAQQVHGLLSARAHRARPSKTSTVAVVLVFLSSLSAWLGWMAGHGAQQPLEQEPLRPVEPSRDPALQAALESARAELAGRDAELAKLRDRLQSLETGIEAERAQAVAAQNDAAAQAQRRAQAEGEVASLREEARAARAEAVAIRAAPSEREQQLESQVAELREDLLRMEAAAVAAAAAADAATAAAADAEREAQIVAAETPPSIPAAFALIQEGTPAEVAAARAQLTSAGLGIVARFHEAYGEDKRRREVAQGSLKQLRRDEAANALLAALEDDLAMVRRLADRYLQVTTRHKLRYDPDAAADDRSRDVARIRDWVQRSYLGLDPDKEERRGDGGGGDRGGGGGRR